ncbi:MAG: family 20 glycosylhydrolase [Bacteroidales bacterium]|nr:family 20 glycosylhydrolase [Bacteroidales bacterium]
MKKLLLIIAVCILQATGFSQDLGIIPNPQQVEYQESAFYWKSDLSKNEKRIKTEIVKDIPAKENKQQAYIIKITPSKIILQAMTGQGLFYARQSLNQLVKYQQVTTQKDEFGIPCMTITDWPALEYRGWMDDISRGPVPTMDFIKKEIRTLASYKMNFFQLYTEHVFKLDSHPDIAPTDGLTAQEIKELTEYAKQYYVEFMGNQQCFAHAEKTLRIPFYDNIADTKYNFDPSNPETYEFLEDLFSEIAPAYESRFFNINCDETEGLGSGKAKKYVEKTGKDEAYCEHINKVYQILKKYDKTVMMWGDIVAKNPKMIEKLPADMQFIVWSYGAGDDYMEMLRPFKESGHEFWAASGASCWSTTFPDINTYTKNIANFARDAYKSGAKGLMNTAWDDYGESLFSSTWHSMLWCAEMTWNPAQGEGFDEKFAMQFLGAELEDLKGVKVWAEPFSALDEPLLEFFPNQVNDEAIEKNERRQKEALAFYETLISVKEKTKENTEFLDCAIVAAYRSYATATKNILKANYYKTLQNPDIQSVKKAKELEKAFIPILKKLKYDYIRLWDSECRAYSRDIVEARFNKIMQDILDAENKVFISSGSKKGTPVIVLKTIFDDKDIYYTTDGNEYQLYEGPFEITRSCTVTAICNETFQETSLPHTEKHFVFHKGMGHLKNLNSPAGNYRPEYSGGGDDALLNGILGSNDYKDGNWQGFCGVDADVEIDFGKAETVNTIRINFLANPFDWIMLPSAVKVYAFPVDAAPNTPETVVKTFKINEKLQPSGNQVFTETFDINGLKTRYLRIVIENPGPLPEGTPGAGYRSWIFADEIIID